MIIKRTDCDSVFNPDKFFRIRIPDPDLEIDLARIRISGSYKNLDRIRKNPDPDPNLNKIALYISQITYFSLFSNYVCKSFFSFDQKTF